MINSSVDTKNIRSKAKSKVDSYQQQIFKLIKQIKGHNNTITIPIALLPFCDETETALFLSQLIYWCDKGKRIDGYIYKSRREWRSEIGLSEYHLEKSSEELEAKGLLETKKKRANGHPTIHYRLKKKAFFDSLKKFLRNDYEKFENPFPNIDKSITEPTTKPTTEPIKDNKGMNSNELHSTPLSFREYKKNYQLTEDTIEAIEYFLDQYEQIRGEKHPNLKHYQWKRVVETIFSCSDDSLDGTWFDLSIDDLKPMIDQYFATEFKEGCNYSILHFNNSGVKVRRMYETVY